MEQMIALSVPIRKNVQKNPKEKSKTDANQKSKKSKKFITPNGVKKFIPEEDPMPKATLEHYLSLETSEE